jgi:Sec-independent protein translocase protein TatA
MVEAFLALIGPGPMELALLALILMLLFGWRIPAVMRSLGQAIKELRQITRG